MLEWLTRRFVKNADDTENPAVRTAYGTFASIVCIVCNTVLCAAKGAVGAAAGICCIARKKGKKCQIVIDLENNAVHPMIRKLQQQPEYAGTFVTASDAFLRVQPGSLLVVVDTNRPGASSPSRCSRRATAWPSSTTTAEAQAISRRWRSTTTSPTHPPPASW